MAIPVLGPVSSQNRIRRTRFWLLNARALVLPQSPNSRDLFPLYHKAYKHVLGQVFGLNEDPN